MATKLKGTSIRLVAADLDGTLLGRHVSTLRFRRQWEGIERARRPWLVYNTGRLLADVRTLVDQGVLPQPDAIIGGVGTELHVAADAALSQRFHARFGLHWDLAQVERIVSRHLGVVRQPPEFLHPFKSSWLWKNASATQLRKLHRDLAAVGVEPTIIYSGGHFLDVLPAESDKGQALQWLCRELGLSLASVAVAGDTGNDAAMFVLKGVQRILVKNALPELVNVCAGLPHYQAARPMADGVLEGLRYFGVLAPATRGRVLTLCGHRARSSAN